MTQTFRCPACNAPLKFEGKSFQTCCFCGSSVIVPAQMFQKSEANIFDDAVELGNKATVFGEIFQEIRAGRKINAIKIFRETFGCGLAEAKDAVEAMERGESVDISAINIRNAKQRSEMMSVKREKRYSEPPDLKLNTPYKEAMKNYQAERKMSFGKKFLIALLLLGGFYAILFFSLRSSEEEENPSIAQTKSVSVTQSQQVTQTQTTKIEKTSVAQEVLKFGGEGTGAGKFKDNRTIAVDAEGKIYSADFWGGRIQIFDSNGVFQTQILAENKSVDTLAVNRQGVLYVLQTNEINRYDAKTGELLGKSKIENASDLTVGLDGKLYVPTRNGEIHVLNSGAAKIKTIQLPKDSTLSDIRQLAIDGANNFYALDGKTNSIFKLSADGNFQTRFGGSSDDLSDKMPKNLFYGSPHDIAIDSKGRVYVSQILRTSVFDANGNFLHDFETRQAFGIAFNDADELHIAARPFVTKYKLNF